MKAKNIIRVALVTALILLIPFFAILFNVKVYDPGSGFEEIDWGVADFVVAGVLLFVTGLALDLAMRKAGKYRVLAALAVVGAFLLVWAELAVGIFGTPWAGS